jgi:hypothetical protein
MILNLEKNYQKLWQNVFLAAWSDASGGNLLSSESEETLARYRVEAQEWLMNPSDDLRMVCEWAGLDYLVAMEKATKKWGRR